MRSCSETLCVGFIPIFKKIVCNYVLSVLCVFNYLLINGVMFRQIINTMAGDIVNKKIVDYFTTLTR
jgi:hypothetical protein